jgi:hypothetical protein
MCQNQIKLGQSSCYLLCRMCFLLGGVYLGLTKKNTQKAIFKHINLEIYKPVILINDIQFS